MIARRDVDLVDKAIEQLKDRIIQILNDSVKDQLYPKALGCIKVLRLGCVQEEEPAAFNTFLRLLRSMHEGKRHNSFWELLLSAGISLIHEEECEESDVSKEESEKVRQLTDICGSLPLTIAFVSVRGSHKSGSGSLFCLFQQQRCG